VDINVKYYYSCPKQHHKEVSENVGWNTNFNSILVKKGGIIFIKTFKRVILFHTNEDGNNKYIFQDTNKKLEQFSKK
jgi:uncharacterized protein YbcV (DUF1398 family)